MGAYPRSSDTNQGKGETMTPEERAQGIMDQFSYDGEFNNWDEIAALIAKEIREAVKQALENQG